ncbi:MAG: hypothetical protein QOG04_2362 [Actinomycetota bacterium]|jgi:hypothetical protein|nr:hypothetical protein [Actinomycetota bacterium]
MGLGQGGSPHGSANLAHMRVKAVSISAFAILVSTLFLSPTSLADERLHARIDDDASCSSLDTLAPEHAEPPVVGDWTTPLHIDARVLLVGVSTEQAVRAFDLVKKAYAPLNIEMRPQFEEVELEIDPPPDTSATGGVLSTNESAAWIQASKDHLGGARPWNADVVYTMLGADISSAVAGQADCVGGIAHPDSAFAVGESDFSSPYRIGVTAKIASHEIAHLLAAHHHFANCVEGDPNDIAADLTPCTMMFNDVGLISLKFGTLEGTVVRRWGLDYLEDLTGPPPPEETGDPESVARSLSFELEERSATGVLSTDVEEGEACTQDQVVQMQRRTRNRKWRVIGETTTDGSSAFSYTLKKAGSYRVVAPASEMPEEGLSCLRSSSAVKKVS